MPVQMPTDLARASSNFLNAGAGSDESRCARSFGQIPWRTSPMAPVARTRAGSLSLNFRRQR